MLPIHLTWKVMFMLFDFKPLNSSCWSCRARESSRRGLLLCRFELWPSYGNSVAWRCCFLGTGSCDGDLQFGRFAFLYHQRCHSHRREQSDWLYDRSTIFSVIVLTESSCIILLWVPLLIALTWVARLTVRFSTLTPTIQKQWCTFVMWQLIGERPSKKMLLLIWFAIVDMDTMNSTSLCLLSHSCTNVSSLLNPCWKAIKNLFWRRELPAINMWR